ncbi:MAG: prephenate dehydrogenase [Clostridiales bacterium]|nr:prephenate dehydrogenase [Clostridiales bacterium]
MTIGIAGLGLIGGSFAKAIAKYTDYTILGFDISHETIEKATKDSSIHGLLDSTTIPNCDIIIVALYPAASIDFVKKHAGIIPKGAIVSDCSGTKRQICAELFPLSQRYGFHFIGGHPMAGLERSGYDNSTAELFSGASMILCPDPSAENTPLEKLTALCHACRFAAVTISTAEKHDELIAYTSQLAHIVSSAYIKSPLSVQHHGFSAGSFKDMTRVAFLNEEMWTELMIENRDYLKPALDALITRLSQYRDALSGADTRALFALLREGKEIKQLSEKLDHE